LLCLTYVGINAHMAGKSLSPLSASEQAIMDLLWKHQPVGLNDLLDRINAGREAPVARATLQTQLTRLETKGWLKRDDSSRAHVYEATVAETKGRTGVLAELKKRLFGGSSVALVRCLVESGEMSKEELAELRKLVRGHGVRKGGES
jgi:BlaI family penicillinase repressor